MASSKHPSMMGMTSEAIDMFCLSADVQPEQREEAEVETPASAVPENNQHENNAVVDDQEQEEQQELTEAESLPDSKSTCLSS